MISAHVLHAFLREFSKSSAMPMATTCSAAISAACHRPDADEDAHLLPVRWGVTDDSSAPNRCAFTTSRDVHSPVIDDEYLGVSQDRANGRKAPPKPRVWALLPALRRNKAQGGPKVATNFAVFTSFTQLWGRRKADAGSTYTPIASER
jgi:hypothetical protein